MSFAPVYTQESTILIVGTYPSPKSRAQGFYYGHPQNRFWRLMALLYNEPLPTEISQKIALLHRHRLALWDTIAHCTITGASDATIRDVVPTDLTGLCRLAPIKRVVCNGMAAYRMCMRYHTLEGVSVVGLPSTSPANAAFGLERLAEQWRAQLCCN